MVALGAPRDGTRLQRVCHDVGQMEAPTRTGRTHRDDCGVKQVRRDNRALVLRAARTVGPDEQHSGWQGATHETAPSGH